MARGTVLTNEVKGLIAKVYLNNPEWKTREIREEVLKQVQQKISWADSDWPSLSSVQKELAKIRKRESARLPEQIGLDQPWSIGSLKDYYMPPEVVPTVLKVQLESESIGEKHGADLVFTIRQALWVGRLNALTTNIFVLLHLSMLYAEDERACELSGTNKMDTRDFDERIITQPDSAYSLLVAIDGEKLTKFAPVFEEGSLLADEVEKELDIHKKRPSGINLKKYSMYLRDLIKWEEWHKLSKEDKRSCVLRHWDCYQEKREKSDEGEAE